MTEHAFAVDLITLYHPEFWGVADRAAVAARGESDPRGVWDRLLDTVAESGVTGIEVTFAPGDLGTALRAYGDAAGLLGELERRGLRIVSGYFGTVDNVKAPVDPAAQGAVLEAAAAFTDRLAAVGGETVVSGLPSVAPSVSRGSSTFLDFDYLKGVADFLNRIGGVVRDHGLRYAIHPEAGSIFCRRREVDLLLALTDPDVVSFCPDTAHLTLADGDPVAIVEAHRERVVLTHWKDAAGPLRVELPDDEHRHEVVGELFLPVGEGIVDWHAWSRMLDRIGFDGWTILELDDCPDPDVQIARARRFAELALGR
jgi:sugar phosphate isomerase/epimerase